MDKSQNAMLGMQAHIHQQTSSQQDKAHGWPSTETWCMRFDQGTQKQKTKETISQLTGQAPAPRTSTHDPKPLTRYYYVARNFYLLHATKRNVSDSTHSDSTTPPRTRAVVVVFVAALRTKKKQGILLR